MIREAQTTKSVWFPEGTILRLPSSELKLREGMVEKVKGGLHRLLCRQQFKRGVRLGVDYVPKMSAPGLEFLGPEPKDKGKKKTTPDPPEDDSKTETEKAPAGGDKVLSLRIREAVAELTEEEYTTRGKPRLDVLETKLGESVSRDQVDQAVGE